MSLEAFISMLKRNQKGKSNYAFLTKMALLKEWKKELLEGLQSENIESLGNKLDGKDIISSFVDEIGQFNYFFRVSLPHENFLNNLPFAKASFCRSEKYFDEYTIDGSDVIYKTATNLHNCEVTKRDDHMHFVCLLDVYSTRIGTLYFNHNDDPVRKNTIFGEEGWRAVATFMTVDLEPERRNVLIYGDLTTPANRELFTSTYLDVIN